MATLRIGSFTVNYDESSLFIHSIKFSASGEVADFSDVRRHSDSHFGDGNNVDVFQLSPSNRVDIDAIMFTGNGNYLADFNTEKKIIEEKV